MNSNGISLEQAPPITAPLRFFLTAPVFLIIAGIIFLLKSINTIDRWNSETIGLIHFFNIGFLVMVMMGALTQMLPVLAGVTMPRVELLSKGVHIILCSGALLFPIGMIFSNQLFIRIGIIAAWLSIFIFYAFTLLSLKNSIASFTVSSFKVSALSALVSLFLIAKLAWGWAGFGEYSNDRVSLLELHIAWAFAGMTLTLIMGVGFKIIPMFFVTSAPPVWFMRYGSKMIFALLCVWTALYLSKSSLTLMFVPIIKIGISILILTFSVYSIQRLYKRKRPLTEASILFWYLGMFLFAFGAMFYSLDGFIKIITLIPTLAALCFGLGFLSVIVGMLYKIIPFLTWLHLTAKGLKKVPTTQEFLSDRHAKKQFYLHCAMTLSLILSVFFQMAKIPFGILLITSAGMTEFLLIKAIFKYRNHNKTHSTVLNL